MQYKLIGTVMPAVEITFDNAGESVFSQSGGMSWMSEGVNMKTNMKGGLGKAFGRMFSGESMFMATFTAQAPYTSIVFSSTVPGEILPINVNPSTALTIQKGAFLAATQGVELNVTFTKRFSAGLFGGEGFILQTLSGNGTAFLEIDGNRVDKVLAPGEVLIVDTGNIVAFESSVKYEIQTVKGFTNVFFGGEGLFLTKLTGPGRVILQTQNLNEFAGRIASVIPSK